MQFCNFLCVFVLSVLFSSDYVVFSSAATPCPVRAVPVFTPEVERGYNCVCKRGFYGTNCRLKARNASQLVVMDGGWVNNNTATLSWLGDIGTKFRLTLRKVSYKDGDMFHSKWQQATIKSLHMVVSSPKANQLDDSGREDTTLTMFGVSANYTTRLRLTHFYNYEIILAILTSAGDLNGSVSLFLDSSDNPDLKNISHNNNKAETCPWYKCPGRFFHVTSIMDDFGKSCFVHGVIFSVPVTIFGILLIGTKIYVIVRHCKRMKNKKSNVNEQQIKTMDETKLSSAKFIDPESLNKKEKVKVDDIASVKSFVIEMTDIDSYVDTFQKDLQAVYITIDDIQVIKPPSVHWTDEEGVSESGSSQVTVSSLE